MRKKKEEPLASFIWCGAVVQVYTQTITFSGTILQRHLLPKNLRSAVQQAVNQAVEKARGEIRQDSTPRHIQQTQRRVRDAESAHYGVSARAVQRRSRKTG